MRLRSAKGGEEQEQLRARLLRVQGQLKKPLGDIEDMSQLTVPSRARIATRSRVALMREVFLLWMRHGANSLISSTFLDAVHHRVRPSASKV